MTGMKQIEKFLKKQTSTLTRSRVDKDGFFPGTLKRRPSASKILPFLKDTVPGNDSPSPKDEFSPDIGCLENKWADTDDELTSPSLSSGEMSPNGSTLSSKLWHFSDTPENIVDHILEGLMEAPKNSTDTEILLDDFLLTHSVFMPTDKLLQVLHKQYCASESERAENSNKGHLELRKQKVLKITVDWAEKCKDLLLEDETAVKLLKDLNTIARKDLQLYPSLSDEISRLQRMVETVEYRPPEDCSCLRKKQVKPLFRHFSRTDICLQQREPLRGTDEIFCRIYATDHSYVTIKSRLSASVQEIVLSVAEKLQHCEEESKEPVHKNLLLVAIRSSGEKTMFRLDEDSVFTTLGVNTHLFACTKESVESLVPPPAVERLSHEGPEINESNVGEMASQITAFDWELLNCVHELELIHYVFRNESIRKRTANLELVLQRCSEVQHWVATEILMCERLGKRVQLLKTVIHMAALCKEKQNLFSFFAIIMGLCNAAVSRLCLTWEKLPAKCKKLFQKFESLTDPSRNHKTYRDTIARMKPPLIPFVPLLLKDMTFIHEGNKTFLNQLVNFEKMHMVASAVRTLRKYRSSPLNLESDSAASHIQIKAYIRQLHVIDNQQLLYDLSYRLEPKDP
ncbi:rap guanine nucleotide exchange factor-like 1 [Hypanus sabinus]|uniref:rap guanine nucleotide exchange factor-like 1 n=1 Tax=Hypanus sabinus TaxID=79690 RepID=UPI0028C4F105|nr:rap guanine nucleotide exchange factor-like 1 [Hypanus sabinus]XP_059812389.1 rap guanine nucleotide exchange factor-like 1 [Hypanus sabinus]